ncbi:unannotated protein [freshwater metagenome]|uniref:Unannotated protein n=1 Tax=freshwater metagenome TaxID=449393 RepID=A0A6J6DA23_9ZZZZ
MKWDPDGDGTGGERTGCAVAGVLERDAVANGHAECESTLQIRLGVWFGFADIITSHNRTENGLSHFSGYCVREGFSIHSQRHGDQSTGNISVEQLPKKLTDAWAPGNRGRDLVEHPLTQALHNVICRHVDASLLQQSSGIPEPAPHQCIRLFGGPCGPELLDQFRFGNHPVGLGVDDGAVHVKKHGSGELCAHNQQV